MGELDASLNIITNESTYKNWNRQNTITLLKWIAIGSSYINILEKNIFINRYIIRSNAIITIAVTTSTGSIGVSQISSFFSAQVQNTLTIILTVLSFYLTILTGVIKVYLIHENLEKYIQTKQEWTSFIASISTELQLPKEERQDALHLIRDFKGVYLNLLNKDIELNKIMQKDIDLNDFQQHSEYKKLYETVTYGSKISISDITSHIVKEEIGEIIETDNEIEFQNQLNKKRQIQKEESESKQKSLANQETNYWLRVRELELERENVDFLKKFKESMTEMEKMEMQFFFLHNRKMTEEEREDYKKSLSINKQDIVQEEEEEENLDQVRIEINETIEPIVDTNQENSINQTLFGWFG
jgi:hypothetical protein